MSKQGPGRQLTVIVDEDLCATTQLCFGIAPGVFRLTDDGYAQVDDSSAATEAQIIEAARRCPTGAIRVSDAATGEALA